MAPVEWQELSYTTLSYAYHRAPKWRVIRREKPQDRRGRLRYIQHLGVSPVSTSVSHLSYLKNECELSSLLTQLRLILKQNRTILERNCRNVTVTTCESFVAVLAWVLKGYLYLVKQITSWHSHRLSWIHNNLIQLTAGFSDDSGCLGEVLILDLGLGKIQGV